MTAVVADIDDLYRERLGPMVALAHSMVGSRAIAEELVHDVFSRLIGRLDRMDEPAAYLRTSVVNACRSWHRREKSQRAAIERIRPADVNVPEPAPSVWEIVDRLPARQRQVVSMRYLEDRSIAETAAALSTTAASVKAATHAGLQRLRSLVERDDL